MSVEKNENQKINPQITEIEIGVRDLRNLKIYPLSVADQMAASDIITEAVQQFFNTKDVDNSVDLAAFFIGTIQKNLARVIGLVTDLKKGEIANLYKDITNAQMSKLLHTVYDINYACIADDLKNALSLLMGNVLPKIITALPSERPSAMSASDTVTGSTSFSGSPSEKVDTPLVN